MHTPQELEKTFWSELEAHPLVMLGLDHEKGRSRPMTAQLENACGPLWFFSSKDSTLVQGMKAGNHAVAAFVAKGHDLFATVEGPLLLSDDRSAIDRLWNRFVAAWYPDGKDDPNLALLRLEVSDVQIWLNDVGVLSGVKILLGADPKRELAGTEARLRMS